MIYIFTLQFANTKLYLPAKCVRVSIVPIMCTCINRTLSSRDLIASILITPPYWCSFTMEKYGLMLSFGT